MAMYVLRLIRTPDKEYKSPRSLGVRVNESRLYIYIYIYIYININRVLIVRMLLMKH